MTESQYKALCAQVSNESAEFRAITERYRARGISDDDFLIARERHQDALSAFDKAYEIVQRDGYDPE